MIAVKSKWTSILIAEDKDANNTICFQHYKDIFRFYLYSLSLLDCAICICVKRHNLFSILQRHFQILFLFIISIRLCYMYMCQTTQFVFNITKTFSDSICIHFLLNLNSISQCTNHRFVFTCQHSFIISIRLCYMFM